MANTLVLNKRGLLVEIIQNGLEGVLTDRNAVKIAYSVRTETQTVALSGFAGTDSYKLTYNASESGLITRGTNDTAAGIKAVIEAIPGFTGTVTVTGVTDTGYTVVFSVANPGMLSVTTATGCSGTVSAPEDQVTFTINAVVYTFAVSEITMNGNAITNYADLLTEAATTFG